MSAKVKHSGGTRSVLERESCRPSLFASSSTETHGTSLSDLCTMYGCECGGRLPTRMVWHYWAFVHRMQLDLPRLSIVKMTKIWCLLGCFDATTNSKSPDGQSSVVGSGGSNSIQFLIEYDPGEW